MSISIIIVNWNSGKLLAECLKSLNEQTVHIDQVYVVDNGSYEQTEYIPVDSDNLKVIRLSKNIGFAAGNNKALNKCKTQYVALLNPDAFPEPNWLENLLKAAEEYSDVAAFGSKQLCYGNPYVLDGVGDIYHASGLVWRHRHGMRQKATDNKTKEIFSPCAAAALYRRQALLDIGGFDEDYFCYIEDVDLGFRLRLAGYKSIYVPEAVVHHIGSATTKLQHNDFSVYFCHRNIIWTYVKNMPGLLFWVLLPLHFIINMTSIIRFSILGRHRVILKSKLEAIKGLKTMWIKRKSIQKNRVASISKIWPLLDFRFLPKKSD